MHGMLGANRIRSLATPSSFAMPSWLAHPNLFFRLSFRTHSLCSQMFDKEVLLVTDPDAIADVLDENTEHYLWGGMVAASKGPSSYPMVGGLD